MYSALARLTMSNGSMGDQLLWRQTKRGPFRGHPRSWRPTPLPGARRRVINIGVDDELREARRILGRMRPTGKGAESASIFQLLSLPLIRYLTGFTSGAARRGSGGNCESCSERDGWYIGCR